MFYVATSIKISATLYSMEAHKPRRDPAERSRRVAYRDTRAVGDIFGLPSNTQREAGQSTALIKRPSDGGAWVMRERAA